MTDAERTGSVLVVDDDANVRDVVGRYLEREGYLARLVSNGEQALESFTADPPDLVVLDLMLPGIDGFEVCRQLRLHSAVPVIMLTALGAEEERIAGLQLGADDYVSKPFSPKELALRVNSVLRRAGPVTTEAPAIAELTDGELRLDLVARTATRSDADLSLTGREFELLAFLIANPGRAFSRMDLLEKVWGWDFGDQSTVTVHVRRLREKIEPEPPRPTRIVTVWGVGYRYDLSGEVGSC